MQRDLVAELLKHDRGILISGEGKEAGVAYKTLQRIYQAGEIEKLEQGLYMDPDQMEDEYLLTQYRCKKGIFSHETALYFHDLTDRTPFQLMLTMLGEHGWYNHKIPCFSLGETFGVEATEVESKINPEISIKRKTHSGHWHREKLRLLSNNTEILGRYSDDTPAVTKNHYGSGVAIYFGTHPEVAYIKEKSALLDSVMDQIMSELSIKPIVELDYSGQRVKEIDAHLLLGKQEDYLILTSYVQRTYKEFFNDGVKKLRVYIRTNEKYEFMKDVITGQNYNFIEVNGENIMDITAIEKQTAFIQLKKKKEV